MIRLTRDQLLGAAAIPDYAKPKDGPWFESFDEARKQRPSTPPPAATSAEELAADLAWGLPETPLPELAGKWRLPVNDLTILLIVSQEKLQGSGCASPD